MNTITELIRKGNERMKMLMFSYKDGLNMLIPLSKYERAEKHVRSMTARSKD